MKRYEEMTKEEIMIFLNRINCKECVPDEFCKKDLNHSCYKTKLKYLDSECETKPRYETIKSNLDMDKLSREFYELKGRENVGFLLFAEWLKEEVEV